MGYGHLDSATIPAGIVNTNILQGQPLAKAYNGTQGAGWYDIGQPWPWPSCTPDGSCNWGDRTGCCYLQYKTNCGAGTGVHFHWTLPGSDITVDGWTIGADGLWRKSGEPDRGVGYCFSSTNTGDNTPPTIIFNTPTANRWYNTNRTFSWSITDGISGVDYYKWGWDDSTPDTQVTGASGSTTLNAAGQGQHRLYVQAWDKAGNASTVASAGWFGYDTTVPTVTFLINNGAITTGQTSVALNLTYGDTGSGVSAARASNNGLAWSDWTPIATSIPWAIPTVDLTTLPVYVQVRDGAGNLSAIVNDTIALDLYPPAPHSANYRMCSTVLNIGGSAGLTSTGYSLVSSIGQAWNSGASGYAGSTFTSGAGFLADVDGCRAITRPASRGFDIPQWVVASGGNTRSSAGYRLGDTTGEAVVSGAQPMQSAGYQLSGGFWAQVVSTTQTCPVPLVSAGIRGLLNLTETIYMDTEYLFTAILTPANATPPMTYTWTPAPTSGQGTATAAYQWATAGSKTINLSVQNCGGTRTAQRTLTVVEPPPAPTLYLPLVLRSRL
ncbi:MAG: hypothetical protein JXA21_01170 [Anaerolineae bacterium]|nr:hypothetical protein [Anaerolineae bacterium]